MVGWIRSRSEAGGDSELNSWQQCERLASFLGYRWGPVFFAGRILVRNRGHHGKIWEIHGKYMVSILGKDGTLWNLLINSGFCVVADRSVFIISAHDPPWHHGSGELLLEWVHGSDIVHVKGSRLTKGCGAGWWVRIRNQLTQRKNMLLGMLH